MEQIKVNVPEGCTASIEQKNGFLIVTFEPEKWVPKDGDIYALPSGGIGIYDSHYKLSNGTIPCYCYLCTDGTFVIIKPDESRGFGKFDEELRPATDAEKQRLFDALAKEGKRWNAEEKRIEDLPRWRAEKGGRYYCLCADSTIYDLIEDGDQTDNTNYEYGNYFRTREAAGKVAEQVRRIFKESKAE